MKHSELRHQPRHVNPRIQVGLYNVKELCEKYDANIVCRNKLDDSENWVEFTLEIAKADK